MKKGPDNTQERLGSTQTAVRRVQKVLQGLLGVEVAQIDEICPA